MTRVYRFVLYFCLGVLIGTTSSFAFADVVPAQAKWGWSSGTYVYSTDAAACQALVAASYPGWTYSQTGVFSDTQSYCLGTYQGSSSYNLGNVYKALSCPTGYAGPKTVAGQANMCEQTPCGTGQHRDSLGNCVCDNGSQTGTNGTCCPAPGDGGGAPMQWCYVESSSATSCNVGGQNGCMIRCKSVTFQTGTGDHVAVYPKLGLGQSCGYTGTTFSGTPGGGELTNEQLKEVQEATKNPEVAKTPEGCLASGSGYITVGGVTTCVSSGEAGEVKKTTTGTETNTVKNPGTGTDETTTKETAKTQTTGTDGTKSTTTTETVTNPNGTKTITTTTTTQNKDGTVSESKKVETVATDGTKTTTTNNSGTQTTGSFCEKNPTDPICAKPSDECKLYPERAGCLNAGTPVEGDALPTQAVGLAAIAPVTVASNATCPADIALPKGMSFSFSAFCMYAEGIRPVVLALAWLAAGFFVFGFRGGS